MPPALGVLAIVSVLCLIGLVMVLSASSVQSLRHNGSSWLLFQRQLLWVALGTVGLVAASRVDYHQWGRLSVPLLGLAGVLLAAVLLPGVGVRAGGSTRWLSVGGWRMQPSELAKLALVVFLAGLLARRGDRRDYRREVLRPALLVFGAVGGLVLCQPDMGTTVVLGCVVLTMLFVGGAPLRTMAGLVGVTVVASFVLGMVEPYRRARMLSFLNPWADPGNTGYQVVQSLVGLGTGGTTGVGVGASRAKWGFLPNAHTDFIFAIIGEELGLLGALLVVALFVGFVLLAARAAAAAPDRFGMLLATGIVAWVGGQAFLNIGAVTGVVPVTGVPLPLVSFGGSSLVILMVAIGVLLNVARQGRRAASGRSRPGVAAGTGAAG
ncbi:MAG TPA: putative lipid II flippase FtsW [Acidimicrobiales bacterium]|nr:putative lipid II flippase FtsW [Acidimicrobiales bacterium]